MRQPADSNPVSRTRAELQRRFEAGLARQAGTSDSRWSVRSSLLLILGIGIPIWVLVFWLFFH
jgi:hypothetical protein